jgi:hypothetical protein
VRRRERGESDVGVVGRVFSDGDKGVEEDTGVFEDWGGEAIEARRAEDCRYPTRTGERKLAELKSHQQRDVSGKERSTRSSVCEGSTDVVDGEMTASDKASTRGREACADFDGADPLLDGRMTVSAADGGEYT